MSGGRPPRHPPTLVLSRAEVRRLLDLDSCIAAVERAFVEHAHGRSLPPGILGMPARGGVFHVKTAGLWTDRGWAAVKVNGNFPRNRETLGLPNIQGVIVLCDASDGTPLALLDSIEITLLRTGAATAVAARRLARADARHAGIVGCGNQGRVQLEALARASRLERARVFDADPERALEFARDMSRALAIEVTAVGTPGDAVRGADVCATCTPSKTPFVKREDVAPGTFIAAVGADNPDKQELEPALLAASTLVVDSLEQCAAIGELHHALLSGAMTRRDVHAELADIVAGRARGRAGESETIVFDSTGTGLQDVAAAALVYERALAAGAGLSVELGR